MRGTTGKLIVPLLLLALAGNGVCLGDKENENRKEFAATTGMLFLDGREFDFGIVQRGIQVRHSFRIVNASDAPLHIVSLRCG
jgi:hypothetical protein